MNTVSITCDEPNTSILENGALRLVFKSAPGGLSAITNKLTGETYAVAGDAFGIETTAFRRLQAEMQQVQWSVAADAVTARYADADLTVEVAYELRPNDHFFQKRMAVTFATAGGVKQIMVSRPAFTLDGLELVCCRHPDLQWVVDYVEARHQWRAARPPDSEPSRTFFGRTTKGGFFTGIEMPYDNSHLGTNTGTDTGTNTLDLGYAPNLKVKASERLTCETMYWGVYRRAARDVGAAEWLPVTPTQLIGAAAHGFNGADAAELSTASGAVPTAGAAPASGTAPTVGTAPAAVPEVTKVLPLPSESTAMTAMASAIFGPPRHGLMAMACGWHSQMEQDAYDTEAQIEGDLRSLDFLAGCGLDGVTDCHPWGGETRKLAALREGERYELGERSRRFLEHAGELGLKVVQWPTMNNTHPWRTHGGPFRMDHPEWLRGVEGEALGGANADNFQRREANCLACNSFYAWLERIILDDALGTGLYEAWCMDGDFWGTGAYVNTTIPVTCRAEGHDHLPGDSNYACQRRLDQLIAAVRRRHPGIYIAMCRPPMDLGVWANRHVDACFTLIESGTGGSNIAAGDEVRTASRIRVHHHFFPHWLDWSLLFPSYADPGHYPEWPEGHIDYLMLSALSCSPNLLLYLPTKTGIPDEDKAEIRSWLDWGRRNVEYLLVRHDLFDWPGKGKVDGSAHLVGNRGLIFLFNPAPVAQSAEFALTPESTGFTGTTPVEIWQAYPTGDRQACPAGDRRETCRPGSVVRWTVPPATAVVLRMRESQGAVGED